MEPKVVVGIIDLNIKEYFKNSNNMARVWINFVISYRFECNFID